MHEGPQKEFFIIGTSSISDENKNKIITRLKESKVALAKKNFFGIPLANEGFMHEGRFIKTLKKLFGIYTLGRHAEIKGVGVITTESSWYEKDINKRIKPHIETINSIIS